MWHTGQAPVVPGPMEMNWKWQQGVLGFLRHLLLLVVEGEEKSEFTVVCYAKCMSVVAASAK